VDRLITQRVAAVTEAQDRLRSLQDSVRSKSEQLEEIRAKRFQTEDDK